MTTRIYLKEQFIPRVGSPVFQIREELDTGDRIIQLDPRHPTPEELTDTDEAFTAAQQARIELLESSIEADHNSLKAEYDNKLAEMQATFTEQEAALTSSINALEAKLVNLQARLDAANIPSDPRLIDPRAWYGRFSRAEIIAIAIRGATDPIVQSIINNLDASIALRENDSNYQMSLDHVNTIQGVGYLQSVGILSADRVSVILSDSKPDEV